MTVAELIVELEGYDGDCEVFFFQSYPDPGTHPRVTDVSKDDENRVILEDKEYV